MRVKRLLADWGAIIAYSIICFGAFWCYCRSVPLAHSEENKDVARVILESFANATTIAATIADFLISGVLCITKKNISKIEILIYAFAFFLLILFNSFAIRYPLSSAWIVLIDCVFFALGTSALLLRRQKEQVKPEEKKSKVINIIKNKKVVAEQLFTSARSEDGEYVTYTLCSVEHETRKGHDVNGILSVSYRLPFQDNSTFEMIRKSYSALVMDGNDDTKDKLISMLKKQKAELTSRLKELKSVDDVKPEHCCIARILMIYLAFLRMLDPNETEGDSEWYGGENYIGELGFADGWLGVGTEIEKRLFTLLRTGLFGAVMLGPELRYLFSYRSGGYKNGRRYSATCLPVADNGAAKVILFTLDGIQTSTVPKYITDAINQEESRVTELLNNPDRK